MLYFILFLVKLCCRFCVCCGCMVKNNKTLNETFVHDTWIFQEAAYRLHHIPRLHSQAMKLVEFSRFLKSTSGQQQPEQQKNNKIK